MLVIKAKSINDLWFKTLRRILQTDENGNFKWSYSTGIIQKGSFEGEQTRLQLPAFAAEVEYPLVDNIVMLPEGSTLPAPTSPEKAQAYFEEYILGSELKENETYTYGSRINISLWKVIEMLKQTPVTNQAVIEIARPEDVVLCKGKDGKDDPPCLRLITFKVRPAYDAATGKLVRTDSRLDLSCFFRSWDLYSGMPENLAGISKLLQFVSDEIEIPAGKLYAYSDGLHLYKYQKELAELRTKLACPEY